VFTILILSPLFALQGSTLPPPAPNTNIRSALAQVTGQVVTDSSVITPWSDLLPLDGSLRSFGLQEGDSPEPAKTTPDFGAEGSTRWSVNGMYGFEASTSKNTEYGFGLGIQWFLVDDFAFAPEIRLLGFSQEGQNAFGGSLDFLFQWHFINGNGWSLYADFGCGLLGTNHNVPSGGSQFNFTPQAGMGVTFDVGQDRRWIVGIRWHHISNASLYQNNPGRDSVMMYTGLNLSF
jgi:lipid A 3-O-deacylase